jgi:hypothetical protein
MQMPVLLALSEAEGSGVEGIELGFGHWDLLALRFIPDENPDIN